MVAEHRVGFAGSSLAVEEETRVESLESLIEERFAALVDELSVFLGGEYLV